ncbi:GNAT family N-acetyltransferase [Sphingopyxis sp. RIFCSPHIGHO2_12_FULL_65_19]|uniref:GNAT family N-acetyltransferase n=1 Tax=Sphingopyxis sp. RIFCSPHIGHO2_12_FULL_65_19 TaxID=1802172 RepID=UPI0008BE9A84|nr:GNAT family N-acetyltransferase [Sphingopyxis sp. RIFCSPHIGHO2_12_FULL_65_19]OHD10011.1 MAG: GNAT family N-acetyltransferase [Sphingopyxis sp. RIFCSPHIGHO2_12_FULL_65_19]
MQGNGEDQANDEWLPATARAAGFASPFDRAAWFDLLTAHGFAGGGRIDAWGNAGSMRAWLPLRADGVGHLAGLTNWYSFSIRPLFDGDGDRAAALRALFGRLRPRAARLTLYPVVDPDEAAAALRAAGWWVTVIAAGDRHWLDLGAMDYDGWWASRPGALRSTVQRKAKKNIVDIQLLTAFDDGSWAAYEQVYAASWKPEEGHPALLRAFAEAEGAGGRLRMGIARIGGIPVAAQFWTVEDGTAFIHKLAHVEDSLKASPGTLLSAALFRHVIEVDRVKRVDFGTGNDAYKRDWMNRHDPLWRIEAFNPARPAAWGPALKAFARSLLRKEK